MAKAEWTFLLGNFYPQAINITTDLLAAISITDLDPNLQYKGKLQVFYNHSQQPSYIKNYIIKDTSAHTIEYLQPNDFLQQKSYAIMFTLYDNNGVHLTNIGNSSTLYYALYYSMENAYIEIMNDAVDELPVSFKVGNTILLNNWSITPAKKYILYLFTTPFNQEYSVITTARGSDSQKVIYTFRSPMLLDHSTLSQGDTIFPLKFNEKITNLKYNYADSITPTLGSAYPFVRRNGAQNYRTFNIEAMIAFEADEFMQFTEFAEELDEYDKARIKQKMYRDRVLEFLHDGKVKLFRSFQEGNMLVRLSNISLTPNEQLDRNIWTFSAQATEVIAPTIENYAKYALTVVGVPEVVEVVSEE